MDKKINQSPMSGALSGVRVIDVSNFDLDGILSNLIFGPSDLIIVLDCRMSFESFLGPKLQSEVNFTTSKYKIEGCQSQ